MRRNEWSGSGGSVVEEKEKGEEALELVGGGKRGETVKKDISK